MMRISEVDVREGDRIRVHFRKFLWINQGHADFVVLKTRAKGTLSRMVGDIQLIEAEGTMKMADWYCSKNFESVDVLERKEASS